MHNLSTRVFFLFSALFFSTLGLAEDDASIARIEHRPVQHPSFQHGHINHNHNQQYHPAARHEMRQDINRAAETNAVNNAGNYGAVPQAVPVYPVNSPPATTIPGNATNSGNSANVYTIPQGTTPTPQH